MLPFTLGELDQMQATQQAAMMDTCVLLRRSNGASNEYGYPEALWTESAPLSCGLDVGARLIASGGEAMGQTQAPMSDARLRLPIDTDITQIDRVKVTHRFGVVLASPNLYSVIGVRKQGPSGLVLDLRLVTNEARDG